MTTEKYINDKKVAVRYGVDRSTIWRWTQSNDFPQPIKLYGSTRWILSELEQWEQQQNKAA